MKLISCRIDNFGKLSNVSFVFDSNPYVIKEDNGYGKTTLAAFISAMFFGLPDGKATDDINRNDRVHYAPWESGGIFGGSLVFEKGGNQYRIEREFGKDDAKRDRLEIWDNVTGRKTDSLGGVAVGKTPPGEILFGINKSSFDRSVFVPQDYAAPEKSKEGSGKIEHGLNEKLRNLVHGTDGKAGFHVAEKILSDTEREIAPPRKDGMLKAVQNEIQQMLTARDKSREQLETAARYRVELKRYETEEKKCDEELKKLKREIENEHKKEKYYSDLERYNEIQNNIKAARAEAEKAAEFFGGSSFDKAELDAIKEKINKIDLQKNIVQRLSDKILDDQIPAEPAPKKRGILFWLAVIFTLGLFLLFAKKQQKPVVSATSLVLKDELKKEKERLQSMEEDADRALIKYKCAEVDRALRYSEIQTAYNRQTAAVQKLVNEVHILEVFMRDKNKDDFTSAAKRTDSAEELKEREDVLNERKKELIQAISSYKNAIKACDAEGEKFADYVSAIEALDSKKAYLEGVLERVRLTRGFLNAASDNLANRYLVPLQEKCREYICGFDAGLAVSFDADGKMLVNEKNKDLDYFSKGTKEYISLCMRFALVDKIFEKSPEKPCVILDDPFTNLSENNLAQAKKLIKAFAKTHQIIYLTCHDSRKI